MSHVYQENRKGSGIRGTTRDVYRYYYIDSAIDDTRPMTSATTFYALNGGFALETRVSKYSWNHVPASGAGWSASESEHVES